MRLKLEKRRAPSLAMLVATPLASVILTMLIGIVVFDLLGINGFEAVVDIFLSPLLYSYKWQNNKQVNQPFPDLFKTEKFNMFNPNPNTEQIGFGLFNNATRQQIKDLTKPANV